MFFKEYFSIYPNRTDTFSKQTIACSYFIFQNSASGVWFDILMKTDLN